MSDNAQRVNNAISSLANILDRPDLSKSLTSSESPALALLRDTDLTNEISLRLCRPGAGAGDDNLCRWLYDTFQSTHPDLQLLVINFVPTIACVYLYRSIGRQPLAGFEAVLLALYAHETTKRGGEAQTIILPNLTNPSVYHEAKAAAKKVAVDLNLAVVSPALEPHGTVRSTKRARIVGVALELYYKRIASMPTRSKIVFCKYCVDWSGQEGILADGAVKNEHVVKEGSSEGEKKGEKWGRIPMPWELFQPVLWIVSHCLLGPLSSEELKVASFKAVQCLYNRAMNDMNSQAILASGSLLRIGKLPPDEILGNPVQ